ncbi:MAG: acetylornithine deacetylase [Methyloligellaceae bacterium]
MSGRILNPKEMLARLVAFDTTSAKTNIPLIEFVEDYLAGHGIASQRVPTEDGLKSSLFATIGPEGVAGIGLSGHTDVVPVTGQNWSSDPFTLTQRGSRLYGRGSCDMKGFIACILSHVPEFKKRKLKTPIHLLLSYDEEVGCTGVQPMIGELGKRLQAPRLVIVGEPTSMKVVDAHKSIHGYETTVIGKESHSGKPQLGVNAIHAAGRLIAELANIDDEMRARADGPRFDPPYTNVAVAVIEGGTARNIIPKECRFTWMFRSVPATDPDEIIGRFKRFAEEQILPAMVAVEPNSSITTRQTSGVPALNAPEGSPAVSLALQLAGQNETHAVSYGTEGGLFERAGFSSVIIGPGDIAQAHAADEFIEESELEKCTAFLDRLADHAESN